MKKLLFLFSILFILVGCGSPFVNNTEQLNNNFESSEKSHYPNSITIKYRNDTVDIAHPRFEYLDTSKSSFVRGAWYDQENEYMVIKLKTTYYHYCGMHNSPWKAFKSAYSFGSHYESKIKGNYDCRTNYTPIY